MIITQICFNTTVTTPLKARGGGVTIKVKPGGKEETREAEIGATTKRTFINLTEPNLTQLKRTNTRLTTNNRLTTSTKSPPLTRSEDRRKNGQQHATLVSGAGTLGTRWLLLPSLLTSPPDHQIRNTGAGDGGRASAGECICGGTEAEGRITPYTDQTAPQP